MMPLFEWQPQYELEIEQIDTQHKELVRMINDLHSALKAGESVAAVSSVLKRLLQYVDIHFSTEESAMRQSRYPGLEGHIFLHDKLRAKVLDFQKDWLQGEAVAIFELLNFLAEWLKEHILKADKAFGYHIKEDAGLFSLTS